MSILVGLKNFFRKTCTNFTTTLQNHKTKNSRLDRKVMNFRWLSSVNELIQTTTNRIMKVLIGDILSMYFSI